MRQTLEIFGLAVSYTGVVLFILLPSLMLAGSVLEMASSGVFASLHAAYIFSHICISPTASISNMSQHVSCHWIISRS